jgi:hypothetical protein
VGPVKEITEANQFLIAGEKIQNEEFEEIGKADYDQWDNFAFLQPSGQVNKDWIILDNCSTADIFCNKKLITNIKTSKKTLKIHCNAGTKLITKEGTLRNYGTVWCSKDVIANILSLSNVKEKYPVKYDSEGGNNFTVVKHDNDVVFEQSPAGLYYHDTGNRAFVMVNTIKENCEGFTRREVDKAKEARGALALVRYPSPKDCMNMVRSNMIKNCPISPTDITNAHKLFGPDIATLKGKTVRRTPAGVMTEYAEIPKKIISLNKNVTLAVDIMFVCGLPFVVSISRKIKFTTVEYLPGRKQPILIKSLRKILRLYQNRGFKVEIALMDREFECLRDDIPELNLNTTSASEHVPDIERQIRVIKERMRAIKSTLPFKRLPARIVIDMMQYAVLWLNGFPPLSGIYQTFSPRTIMTGTTLDFKKHCRVPFGAYVEAHEDYDTTNTMAERTRGTICLGPTANFQGSYKILCLNTARRVTRKQFKELPMPTSVIKRIANIAEREKQGEDLIFTDRNGNAILDPNQEHDVLADAGMDTGTENETGGNNDDDNNDQPLITDDDEQPGINMENQEIGAEGMIEEGPEGDTAGVAPEGEQEGETAGVAPEDDHEELLNVETAGVIREETAGVFEGNEPNDETAGVLGDETAGVLGGNKPNDDTA